MLDKLTDDSAKRDTNEQVVTVLATGSTALATHPVLGHGPSSEMPHVPNTFCGQAHRHVQFVVWILESAWMIMSPPRPPLPPSD